MNLFILIVTVLSVDPAAAPSVKVLMAPKPELNNAEACDAAGKSESKTMREALGEGVKIYYYCSEADAKGIKDLLEGPTL